MSLDGPDGVDFNFPPPDFGSTPENSTHVYFKDIILPASDEVGQPSYQPALMSSAPSAWSCRESNTRIEDRMASVSCAGAQRLGV